MNSKERESINTLRILCADMVQKANSGHPGAPMGLAPIAYVLFAEVMKYNPKNPEWQNRDRFVLSNGHACALQYACMHLTGNEFWSMDVLKSFRQLDSPACGHPESENPGIEMTTGPLGQGVANGVGLAMAERHLSAVYNRPGHTIVDNYTYVVCGDGCMQEGVASEASSLAGHLGLGKLILIYDQNYVTIDGHTDLSFTEDVMKRYESYGWHTQYVDDGDEDLDKFRKAIQVARETSDKPSLIAVKTTIGYGSSKRGTEKVHGSPLGEEELKNVKKKFGMDPEKYFAVPNHVYEAWDRTEQGRDCEQKWNEAFESYRKAHPDLAEEFERRMSKKLPDGWEKVLPTDYKVGGPSVSTRKASGDCINALSKVLPEIFGGSADLNPSTFTYLKDYAPFQKNSPEGRNVHFGVREHAMMSILNGLATYNGIIPYGSTFLNFLGYCLPPLTLSAESHIRTLHIFTHDSIGLGEDGPTHQPVEKFMICRMTPHLVFIRPSDGTETTAAYIAAIRRTDRPVAFALSRQNLPQNQGSSIDGLLHGAYALNDVSSPQLILVATGSEVEIALKAVNHLQDTRVRVVSFPSWELFEDQDQSYREHVFPPNVPVLSIEAGTPIGWERYAHASIGINHFGASAPSSKLYERFGFTPENIANKAKLLLQHYSTRPVPHLVSRPF
ncbi:uncharacterized protein LOC126318198 [Schistocerca gregaria]|uniref:uncharacterized protein LOC126318198 n=1 Tax=Schistocerca gregaria TaxID=7010 RepID=UPI00211EC050|nr:uncharacterized protein LOC126318198 [Schistocerca gregaria]